MEGCVPSLVLRIKKNEVFTKGELMEPLSLTPLLGIPVVLEVLVILG